MNSSRLLSRCLRGLAIPAALLLLLAVTSCRRDTAVRSALARAEAVMEENPGAARQILDSIAYPQPLPQGKGFRSPRLQEGMGEANLALWALLKTQAEHKCRVRAKSDSLPLIATRYYGTKRKTQPAALAQHYLGCAYSDMGRDLEAMDAFLRASTLFPDTTNKYFANNLFELGLLYSNHQMEDSAWVALSRYRQTAVCNSDSVNIGYADYYMGSVAMYKGADDVADSLFHRVEGNTRTTTYNRFNTCFQLAKLYYYHKHDIDGAIAYLNKVADYFGADNGTVLSLKADILAEQNQPARAYELYKKALQNSTDIYTLCSCYEGLAGIASLVSKPDSTRYYFNQYKALQDTIYVRSKQKELAEVKDKHIVEIHDQQLKARHTRFLVWTWMGTVVFLLGIAILFLLVDRKRKSERLKYEAQLKDIKQRYLSVRNTSFSLQEERKKIYQREYESSDWARYLKKHQPDVKAKQFMPAADAKQFEQYLNELFVDMLLDLVKENPDLTEEDTPHCAMTLLGFKPAQIAYCSRTSPSSCYTRRNRIKTRLTPDWCQFIFDKAPE